MEGPLGRSFAGFTATPFGASRFGMQRGMARINTIGYVMEYRDIGRSHAMIAVVGMVI
jgi:hypothetical protein